MPLTDALIRKLQPQQKLYRQSDGGGLLIEVSPKGGKKFRLNYRIGKAQKTLLLGDYPAVKLTEARYMREVAKQALREGDDPKDLLGKSKSKHKAGIPAKLDRASAAPKPAEPVHPERTYKHWQNEYLVKRKREGAADSTISKLRLHARLLEDSIGHLDVCEVSARDVIRACSYYEKQNKLNSAQAMRNLCSQVFRFAIAYGEASNDPAQPARDAIARPIPKNHAAVTEPSDVGRLMKAVRTSLLIRYAPCGCASCGGTRRAINPTHVDASTGRCVQTVDALGPSPG